MPGLQTTPEVEQTIRGARAALIRSVIYLAGTIGVWLYVGDTQSGWGAALWILFAILVGGVLFFFSGYKALRRASRVLEHKRWWLVWMIPMLLIWITWSVLTITMLVMILGAVYSG